jgi:hypothetical protein
MIHEDEVVGSSPAPLLKTPVFSYNTGDYCLWGHVRGTLLIIKKVKLGVRLGDSFIMF